ncbi:Spc98 family-domain-containing protein [Bombardia bombarda]|uniref:Spindle pole body component n=1 Tax=Bombardia bombarda TaxID=252184 RepID=A0AA39WLX1_9PEZI|nr:Spc98 family-domain-containing protein [Bombardia bombarda]
MEGACTAARLVDWLRGELQTGYSDVEEVARSLVKVAETAWLKQVSAWILYGKLPAFGAEDFFVQREGGEYVCVTHLLPSFVTPSTASSMLFIGRSLNQIRTKSLLLLAGHHGAGGRRTGKQHHLSTQLSRLSKLSHPLDSATFARAITDIRNFLSRTILQRLLPLSRVLEALELLRDFFLLRRGEFAMALTQQADEKMRSRWQRVENLAGAAGGGGNSSVGSVVVKEGEIAAVLVKTWAAMGSMQGEHAEEDEGVELAREMLRLVLTKSQQQQTVLLPRPMTPGDGGGHATLVTTPFRNLLFSVPVTLTFEIPSPLDLFLSQADLRVYEGINAYLLSLRRAHLRLTDLWKITGLRRHHPAPPGGGGSKEKVKLLRRRYAVREGVLRSAWATASAAIFFLGETEGYLQMEVVAGLSDGFGRWLARGEDDEHRQESSSLGQHKGVGIRHNGDDNDDGDDDDLWLDSTPSRISTNTSSTPTLKDKQAKEEEKRRRQEERHPRDPQTLATAHRLYLRALVRRLLLDGPRHQPFTDALYALLVHIDHLVALVHRLHGVWAAADLEADVGVVDAFVDLDREERDVQGEMRAVEGRVKRGVEGLVGLLRGLVEHENANDDEIEQLHLGEVGIAERDWGGGDAAGGQQQEEEFSMREIGQYVPRRVGGVDRLLMKLDFGSWFGAGDGAGGGSDEDMLL